MAIRPATTGRDKQTKKGEKKMIMPKMQINIKIACDYMKNYKVGTSALAMGRRYGLEGITRWDVSDSATSPYIEVTEDFAKKYMPYSISETVPVPVDRFVAGELVIDDNGRVVIAATISPERVLALATEAFDEKIAAEKKRAVEKIEQEKLAEKRKMEREEREREEREARIAKEEAIKRFSVAWLSENMTNSELYHMATEGVLHLSDLISALEGHFFAPIKSFPVYNGLKRSDVCTCEYDRCRVDFEVKPLEKLTLAQWSSRKKIQSLLPGALLTVREHEGVGEVCGSKERNVGLFVSLPVADGLITLTTELAVQD